MSTDKWAVVVGEDGQGNPLNPGNRETALDQPSEKAARQVYRDSVGAAQSGRWYPSSCGRVTRSSKSGRSNQIPYRSCEFHGPASPSCHQSGCGTTDNSS